MKTFDGFIFFNEIDMALLRMHILKDVVDYHVVVEAGMTHSGQPKPYYFWGAFEQGVFDAFKDRIIYSRLPELGGGHSWARERFHRAHIGKVLQYNAQPDDLVIIADCDEIPSAEAVRAVPPEGACLELDLYYYDVHHRVHQGWGIGALRWGMEHDTNRIRTLQGHRVPHLLNAGWHFSYFLTPERVVEKLDAFMHHADVAKDVPRDPTWIAEKMSAGEDIFGRTVQIDHVPLSDSLPQHLRDNLAHYQALGWAT